MCVCVETKSCLPLYIESKVLLQMITNESCVPFDTQGLLSAVQWCRLWHTLNLSFLVGNSVFVSCLDEISSFFQEEWMEYCTSGAGMSNPHLWVVCDYNCLFCEGNNVPLPLPSEFPTQLTQIRHCCIVPAAPLLPSVFYGKGISFLIQKAGNAAH